MFDNQKFERQYRRERRQGHRMRMGAVFEQAIFVAFMAAVVVFGLYLLFNTGEQAVVDNNNTSSASNKATPGQSQAGVGENNAQAQGAEQQQASESQPTPRADGGRWSARMDTQPLSPDRLSDTQNKHEQASGRQADASQAQSQAAQAQASQSQGPEHASSGNAPSATASAQADTTTKQPKHSESPAQESAAAAAKQAPAQQTPESSPKGSNDAGEQAAAANAGQAQQKQPASAPKPASPPIRVLRAMFAYHLDNGQPVKRVNYINYSDTQNGRLYFFTEVSAPQGGTITHEWRHNGEVVMQQSFDVHGRLDTSSSSYVIGPHDRGNWRVYVRDAAGKVIKIGSALYR